MKTHKIYRLTIKTYLQTDKQYYIAAESLTEVEQKWEKYTAQDYKTPVTVEVVAEGVNQHVIPAK